MKDKEIKNFPAKVAEVLDQFTVVINRGSIHGIDDGQRFLIYGPSDKEINDPDTGEFLGYLSIPKGEGIAVIVDEKLTTLKSNEREPPKKPGQLIPISTFAGLTYFPGQKKPFKDPKIGDKAKPVK